MANRKYSNVLTILLVIVIIAIVGLVAFIGYDFYRKYYLDKDAEDFMSRYEQDRNVITEENTITGEDNTIPPVIDPGTESNNSSSNSGGSSSGKTYTYKGFTVLGTIEIPKTGIKYPILEKMSKKALETSIVYQYGTGLNEVGNTTLAGHNYKNGSLFGKNKQLAKGDIVYITDNSGRKIKYTIYETYRTTPEDGDYLTRDTAGKREISLTTCTDDSKGRLVIWAKE